MSERWSGVKLPAAYTSAVAKRAEHFSSARGTSNVNLFGYRQGVIDLDAEVAHGALDLLMSK
jgi:hypothetical protein